MPPRKKTRRFGKNGTTASSSLSSGSTHHGPGSSTRRSAAILASATSGVSTPRTSSGRNTQNSKGNRGTTARKAAAKKTPNSKPSNGRSRGGGRAGKRDSSQLQSPASYKAENGEVYKRGGTHPPRTHTHTHTHACTHAHSHACILSTWRALFISSLICGYTWAIGLILIIPRVGIIYCINVRTTLNSLYVVKISGVEWDKLACLLSC